MGDHHQVCRSPHICPCNLIGRTVCQSAAMPTDRCRFESGLGLARSIVLDVRISYGLAVSPPCAQECRRDSDNHIAAWTNKVGTGLPPPVRWQKMARVTVGGTVCISRSRAVVARLVHTQEAAGSSPASATSPFWGILSPSLYGGLVFAPAFNLPTRPPLLGDIAQLAERWLCKP